MSAPRFSDELIRHASDELAGTLQQIRAGVQVERSERVAIMQLNFAVWDQQCADDPGLRERVLRRITDEYGADW